MLAAKNEILLNEKNVNGHLNALWMGKEVLAAAYYFIYYYECKIER